MIWDSHSIDGRPVEGGIINGGTIKRDRPAIWKLLESVHPDILIYEEFKLYPDKAKHLAYNTFYTCEIIGILRLWGDTGSSQIIAQQAANKRYSGAKTSDISWTEIKARGTNVTEHTYDAYMHWCYYRRFHRV